MWFWWFMFCCDILIPVTMIACGWMMWKYCPKNINGLVGYRTSRSMRNMDTWKFELSQINDAARLVHEGHTKYITAV